MTVSWTDSSQIRITRLKLGLCHKVWFWSDPFHSSVYLSWRLFLPLFDSCYPDIPVFSLWLTVFQDLVSQALDRTIVFHGSYSIFCFLWYDRSDLLIYVPDTAAPFPETLCRFFQHCTFIVGIIRYLFYSAKTVIIDAQVKLRPEFYRWLCFSSDDRSDPWLCNTDNAVFYTLWVLFWYMYCCCSYSL